MNSAFREVAKQGKMVGWVMRPNSTGFYDILFSGLHAEPCPACHQTLQAQPQTSKYMGRGSPDLAVRSS